jgi:hypothetical protein
MKWDQSDFFHLFIPVDESPTVWDEQRTLASDLDSFPSGLQVLFSPSSLFTRHDGQVDDIHIVRGTGFTGKVLKLIRIKIRRRRRYVRRHDNDDAAGLEITYPLIEARPIVKCSFLLPMPDESKGVDAVSGEPEDRAASAGLHR